MWNEICAQIFTECVQRYKEKNIRYFILRNYESLPENNTSKDVDIIIERGYLSQAKEILLDIYKKNGCTHHHEVVFGRVHCIYGMSFEKKVGIHIDLIEGYLSKGYEIFTFEELYAHTYWYKGFCVLDKFFEGIMILIYKQFGYTSPKLKPEYRACIYETYKNDPNAFKVQLETLTNSQFTQKIMGYIENQDFESVISEAKTLTKLLRKYSMKKAPIKTAMNCVIFLCQKINRCILRYHKYKKVFAVIAPDGTGKTTFIDLVLQDINYYYVSNPEDQRCTVCHFRPTILPNLGELGEKAGAMKQDTDWTNPHRGKLANPLSSLVRIAYYTCDYILGWQKIVRKDVQYDRFTIFDRYSYDFIVDPMRTKLNLPEWVRKFFVTITPQPTIVFVLDAAPEIIYKRKQELTQEEIIRQLGLYRKLAQSHKRFRTINAEQTPEDMIKEAMQIILDEYAVKF